MSTPEQREQRQQREHAILVARLVYKHARDAEFFAAANKVEQARESLNHALDDLNDLYHLDRDFHYVALDPAAMAAAAVRKIDAEFF